MQIARTLVLTMALALSGCVPNAQADDPAIVVCEEIIKLGLIAPKTYERVSARVEDRSAHISYDAMNAAGVTLRSVHTCEFEERADGNFGLSIAWTSAGINERLEELRLMKVKASSLPTYEERFATLNAIDAESDQTARQMRENISLHMSYELVASSLAIYPIKPQETKLLPKRQ